jgi:hypothetical protein
MALGPPVKPILNFHLPLQRCEEELYLRDFRKVACPVPTVASGTGDKDGGRFELTNRVGPGHVCRRACRLKAEKSTDRVATLCGGLQVWKGWGAVPNWDWGTELPPQALGDQTLKMRV